MNVESTCWAFFRGGAKASQAARSISLFTLRSPQIGAGFLPLSTITPPWLVKWGRADLRRFFFPFLYSFLFPFLLTQLVMESTYQVGK